MAKSEKGSYRMNISIPVELKEQMDEEGGDTNWSSVAAAAFERKLTEVAARQQVTDRESIIARMKAAEKLEEDEEHQAGCKAGKAWAEQGASPRDLRRLDDNDTVYDFDGIPEAMPQDGLDAKEFWEWALGEDNWQDAKSDTFCKGFAEAALEVWYGVRKDL